MLAKESLTGLLNVLYELYLYLYIAILSCYECGVLMDLSVMLAFMILIAKSC